MNQNLFFTQIDPGGTWHITWFLGLAVVIVLCMKELSEPIEAKLLWGYILVYALYLVEYPAPHFKAYTIAFQSTAGQAFIEAFMIPISIYFFHRVMNRIIPWVIGVTIACVWCHWDGLMVASSFNTALIALSLPFLPSWLFWIALYTVLAHHGSTALLIVAAQAFAYTIKKTDTLGWFLVLMGCLFGIAYLHHTGAWLDGSERLQKYDQFMRFWFYGRTDQIPYAMPTRPYWKWVIAGVGPGTFMWFSLIFDHFKGNLFLQMHSDWLQILWETGVVGLGLTIAVFMRAAKNAWNDVKLLSALFGCAAFGITYHPMRWFPTALLTTLIVYLCLNCRKCSYPKRR